MTYADTIDTKHGYAFSKMINETSVVCECKITFTKEGVWNITSWFTKEEYQHQGNGVKLLKHLISYMIVMLGVPTTIEYTWNGSNQYVMDWLEENFNPVCKLPLAVLKYQEADTWEAHIYILDTDKVLKYCDIEVDV